MAMHYEADAVLSPFAFSRTHPPANFLQPLHMVKRKKLLRYRVNPVAQQPEDNRSFLHRTDGTDDNTHNSSESPKGCQLLHFR